MSKPSEQAHGQLVDDDDPRKLGIGCRRQSVVVGSFNLLESWRL